MGSPVVVGGCQFQLRIHVDEEARTENHRDLHWKKLEDEEVDRKMQM